MNRREAIAALIAMPAVTHIAAVPANSDDVIVFECEGQVSQEALAIIQTTAQQVWPGRRIAVLVGGIRIKVVPS